MIAVALLACSTRARDTPIKPPPEAPREVFAAYHLGGARIEGAPPIDHGIGKALARYSDRPSARLLDVGDSPFGAALTLADGECMLVVMRPPGPPPVRRIERPCGRAARDEVVDIEWGRFTRSGVVVSGDRDGDEQLRLQIPGAGFVLSPKGRATDPIVDASRNRLFYGFTTGDNNELWTSDLETNSRRIAGDGPWAPLDVSRDGKFVLARRETSSAESALYRIDVDSGAAVALTAVGNVSTPLGRFTATGELVVITDAGSDRLGLVVITERTSWRLAGDITGDVTDFVLAADGSLVFVTSTDGVSTLRSLDLATGQHHVIAAALADGVITDLRAAPTTPAIGFSFSSARGPRGAYTLDLQTSLLERSPVQAQLDVTLPILDHVTASDGVHTSLLAYLPTKPGRHAVVLELHGGPEDQWLPRYSGFVQFLVDRGYAVIRPNVRGSAGQGRAFAALDDGRKREAVLLDVGAVLDWIAQRPELDKDRVFVMGTSYGGYVALASLLRYRDRLRGGITLGAITDLVGFLEGTAAYRRDHRRAEYGDERDPTTRAFLAKISPSAASELKKPLLVAHGARDPRVPITTAERFVQAARASGSPVWSIVAADEGHLFTRNGNRATFEILAAQFLDQFSK